MAIASDDAQVHPFLAWVLVLSVPFYAWGIAWPVAGLPLGLPVSAAMVVVPSLVASLLTARERSGPAVRDLWSRIGDVRRIKGARWLAIAFLWMPAASAIAFVVMSGVGLPLPADVSVAVSVLPNAFALYFVGAIFEEIGWTAYATDRLQRRYGVVIAGVIIGTVWATWHVVPWWFGQGRPLRFLVGQSLGSVIMRVTMGWIHARGGRSVFLAVVFHTMINVSYTMYPNAGSHYDPVILSAVLTMMLLAVGLMRPA